MSEPQIITAELFEEPNTSTITEASLDGKKYFPVTFVATSDNPKAPYICRRRDLSRAVLREYKYVKASENTYYVTYNGKKYLLIPKE